MSTQVKMRVFAGEVCDQIVCRMPDHVNRAVKNPRPRFKTDAEREEHCRQISKRNHALLINANFGPSSYFSTLTFSDAWEVYDFKDARRLRDNYIRRLRRRYPDAKLAIYMGRGKSTARIHLHMLSDGIPPEVITELWNYGSVKECKKFRDHNVDRVTGKDHGHDYTNLANYCFEHWSPEQGKGKRYYHTNNFQQPEREKPTLCKLHYYAEHPPRAPKGYIYTGDSFITSYGYMRFRYIIDPHRRC